jgi:hypothetical protein
MHGATLSLLTHDLEEKQAGRGQTDPDNPYVGTKLTVEELKRRVMPLLPSGPMGPLHDQDD